MSLSIKYLNIVQTNRLSELSKPYARSKEGSNYFVVIKFRYILEDKCLKIIISWNSFNFGIYIIRTYITEYYQVTCDLSNVNPSRVSDNYISSQALPSWNLLLGCFSKTDVHHSPSEWEFMLIRYTWKKCCLYWNKTTLHCEMMTAFSITWNYVIDTFMQ